VRRLGGGGGGVGPTPRWMGLARPRGEEIRHGRKGEGAVPAWRERNETGE
jgi:hypothetical protein